MKKVIFSPGRIRTIAKNTFLEAVRQKFFSFLVVIALGIILSSQVFRDFNFGAPELKFIADFGFGAIVLFGSVLAIVATAQLFFSEIENKTAITILAKPVFRSEFIFGKFLGVALLLLVFTAMMTVILSILLFWRESALMEIDPEGFEGGRIVAYRDVFLFGLVQWLKFSILCGITMVIASFSNTNLYSVIISFVVLLICHLQYLAQDAWMQMDFLPVQIAVFLLASIFPNFQVFNIGDQVAMGEAIPLDLALRIVGYALIYVVVFNLLAVFSFRKREI